MRVRVKVPATTANLGPGFDTLGMALSLYNEIEVEPWTGGVKIEVSGEGKDLVPRATNNSVYQAIQMVYERIGIRMRGVRIHIHNEIPVTRGLGSSATAIVGGLLGANALCGNLLTESQLIEMAVQLEGHPDNVAPALLGGVVVSGVVGGKTYVKRFNPPEGLRCVVVTPDFQLSTLASRRALPASVAFKDAVHNVNCVALLVSALAEGDLTLFSSVMQDRLHEPYRRKLIPGMEEAFAAAKGAGALSVALSGSGPSLIAFCTSGYEHVGHAMRAAFQNAGVTARVLQLFPEKNGAQVLHS
ncbi:homoserine kinase [Collibacillus ludicampi]|uniref:Homoserine kinase n=1 Tax=Collibacillus ludicampi TaxID=2771369 RepID=A0AAV4LA61_9BACL|nr:homoserine kinase [Collibacillus ludicampi]GIM44578.1 homoserine kinase [Collibacillus ludicampi]